MRPSRAIGLLLFALALGIYWATVLRVDVLATGIARPAPEPDAAEYFAMMCSIHEGSGPVIRIAGESLPSRYPHGYSALAAPLMWVLPEDRAILAPFIANMAWGAATLIVVFAFFAFRGDVLRGGIAALLVATLPAFMTLSRSSMSEPLGAFLVVCGFLAMAAAFEGRVFAYIVAAAALGLSINVRLSLVYFLPILGAPLLCREFGPWRRRLGLLFVAGSIVGLCVAPTALVNLSSFGSPLRTGYSFWLVGAGPAEAFRLKYVPLNLSAIWTECILAARPFTTSNLFGTGSYFVPAFALLVALFAWPGRWSRAGVITAGTVGIAMAASLCYFFISLRFFYPLLVLACIAASGGVSRAVRSWSGPRQIVWASIALALMLGVVVGYPSSSGFPSVGGRSQLVDGIRWASRRVRSHELDAALLMSEVAGSGPALVLSDTNPAFLSAILGARFACAPIDGEHAFRHSAQWRFDAGSAAALVGRYAAAGIPVYAVAEVGRDHAGTLARLPAIKGLAWCRASEAAPDAAAVWSLVPEADCVSGSAPNP
jgi:hypothetical protein